MSINKAKLLYLLLLLPVTPSPITTQYPASFPNSLLPPHLLRTSSPTIPLKLSSTTSTRPSPTSAPPTPFLTTGPTKFCSLVISPPRLVVRFGEAASANCSMTNRGFYRGWQYSLENIVDNNSSVLTWEVNNLTDWQPQPTCFVVMETDHCTALLDVTVYQPPDSVSISYYNHSGPMIEGGQYVLQCNVKNIAPIRNLTVTFYRGEGVIGTVPPSSDTEKEPVTRSFTVSITARGWEDNGAQYWCEAMLMLEDGPRPPPVVRSHNLTATVHFGPELRCPAKVQVKEGGEIPCQVRGNPVPFVSWTRDGVVVASPTRLRREQAGKYIVSAEGTLGRISHTLDVEVLAGRGVSCASWRCFVLLIVLIQLIYLEGL